MTDAPTPQKILIVKLSSLGDTLHALPVAAELRDQLGAEIHWAVQPELACLVRQFACVDKVIPMPRPSKIGRYLNAIRKLRDEDYDLVVDLQGLMKSALVARSARAPRRIGPSFAREGAPMFYTDIAGERDKNRHAVDECLDVIRHLGLKMPRHARFPLTIPDVDLDAGFPLKARGPRIAVAPLSRWESKNWPAEHFAKLIAKLVTELDARVYLTGGPIDTDAAERILIDSRVEAVNLCGIHTIAQTLGVLAQCDALVSNDSGPMHMGAAVGLPCVVPFGPTSPERTGPYGDGHAIVRMTDPVCPKPCRKRQCQYGDPATCMRGITPDLVFNAVRAVL